MSTTSAIALALTAADQNGWTVRQPETGSVAGRYTFTRGEYGTRGYSVVVATVTTRGTIDYLHKGGETVARDKRFRLLSWLQDAPVVKGEAERKSDAIDAFWREGKAEMPRPYSDLDVKGERFARAAYLQRKDVSILVERTNTCYRCSESTAQHIRLRVSSLTPVCATHAADLSYSVDLFGSLVEDGPYSPSDDVEEFPAPVREHSAAEIQRTAEDNGWTVVPHKGFQFDDLKGMTIGRGDRVISIKFQRDATRMTSASLSSTDDLGNARDAIEWTDVKGDTGTVIGWLTDTGETEDDSEPAEPAEPITIRETIHHGDYRNVRVETVAGLTAEHIADFLHESPYRGPEKRATDDAQVVRIVAELTASGRSHLGWARYEVVADEAPAEPAAPVSLAKPSDRPAADLTQLAIRNGWTTQVAGDAGTPGAIRALTARRGTRIVRAHFAIAVNEMIGATLNAIEEGGEMGEGIAETGSTVTVAGWLTAAPVVPVDGPSVAQRLSAYRDAVRAERDALATLTTVRAEDASDAWDAAFEAHDSTCTRIAAARGHLLAILDSDEGARALAILAAADALADAHQADRDALRAAAAALIGGSKAAALSARKVTAAAKHDARDALVEAAAPDFY